MLRACSLNTMIAEFCHVMSNLPIHPCEEGNPRQQKLLRSLLKRASYISHEIELWDACIPGHWKKQYQYESADSAAISPPGPWTITFLATTHSAQIAFYNRMLSCYKAVQRQDPDFRMPSYPGDTVEFCESIENRIAHLLKTICYVISLTIGFLDADHIFRPVPTANFANSNALVWPMWAVISCPFASQDQIALCRRVLDYVGRTLGHKLAFSLSRQPPDAYLSEGFN